jgi:hypothetical protein
LILIVLTFHVKTRYIYYKDKKQGGYHERFVEQDAFSNQVVIHGAAEKICLPVEQNQREHEILVLKKDFVTAKKLD